MRRTRRATGGNRPHPPAPSPTRRGGVRGELIPGCVLAPDTQADAVVLGLLAARGRQERGGDMDLTPALARHPSPTRRGDPRRGELAHDQLHSYSHKEAETPLRSLPSPRGARRREGLTVREATPGVAEPALERSGGQGVRSASYRPSSRPTSERSVNWASELGVAQLIAHFIGRHLIEYREQAPRDIVWRSPNRENDPTLMLAGVHIGSV